jgi:hypothetical protein
MPLACRIDAMDVLTITRGADFSAEIAFDDGETPPVAINLTGSALTAVIAWAGGSQTATIAVTNAAGGLADLSLTEAQTLAVPPGRLSRLTITRVMAGETTIQSVDVEAV